MISTASRTRKLNRRWVAPTAAAGLVIAAPAVWTAAATAEPTLPPRTAEEIVADVLATEPVAFSGELRQSVDLGLPSLGYEPGVDFTDPDSIWSLASGSNTWRVWYDGEQSYRVAIVRGTSESDLISNGSVVWAWSSDSQTAVRHEIGAAADDDLPVPVTSPAEAARQILAEFDSHSTVTTDANTRVAGRDVYELVITPTDDQTRVQQVRLAVDAETSLPLRLQVHSTTTGDAVVEIGFTRINYSKPNASVFEFTPPPGAEVIDAATERPELPPVEQRPGDRPPGADVPAKTQSPEPGADRSQVFGEGWSTVTVVDTGADPAADLAGPLGMLPEVSGDWGSGVLLDGTLISLVLTDDGRMAWGAVAPEVLFQALGR